MDLVLRSSTTVNNRVQFKETISNYEEICETMKAFYVKESICILCKNNVSGSNTECDLENESKVNRTCNLRPCNHPIKN